MRIELPEVRPEERTPLVECLVALIQQLLDRVRQLEVTNQQLRDEVAILKGQKPRPAIRPNQLESPPSAASSTEGCQNVLVRRWCASAQVRICSSEREGRARWFRTPRCQARTGTPF